MIWFVLVAGFLAIALWLIILVRPRCLRKIIDFLSIGSRLYLAGVLHLVIGIMLLILAKEVRLWGYVVITGLLAAASGFSIFFFALKRTKKLLCRLQHQSSLILRLYAIIALVLWVFLVYALLPASSLPLLH